MATGKFKQGMRLLTIRRVKISHGFWIEAKWVAALEIEFLNGSQSV